MRSECYLLVYDGGGALLSRRLLRRDSYACVQGKVQKKPQTQPSASQEEANSPQS